MIVGYDVSILEDDRFTGVEKVAYYLYSEMWEIKNHWQHILFCRKKPLRLQETPENVQIIEVGGGRFWRYWHLPRALKEQRLDCFLSPVTALPFRCNYPMLPYVHECQWLHESAESYNWKHIRAFRSAAKRSPCLITNSQFTSNDIIKDLGFSPRIELIPPAGDPELIKKSEDTNDSFLDKHQIPKDKPIILFVSSIRPKKNVKLLLETFSLSEMKEISLVIVGKLSDSLYFDQLKKLKPSNAYFTDYLSDSELRKFYNIASSFVYISANEGFGLPILEAYGNSLPVVASNLGSIPEVAGNGAVYCEELTPKSLSETIRNSVNDSQLRNTLIKKQKEQLKKYNWRNSAIKLSEVIESLVR